MNEKGQEFSGFRLLVEAVMVVFILSIILVTVSQLDAIRQQVSERRLFEGFQKAVRSPDGSIILEENIVLVTGSAFTRRTFSALAIDILPECVAIEASDSTAFSTSGSTAIEITTLVQTNIYYQCVTQYGKDCKICCTVSFGEELEQDAEPSCP